VDRSAAEWLPQVSARRFRLTNISNRKLWRGAAPPGPWGLARDFEIIADQLPYNRLCGFGCAANFKNFGAPVKAGKE
jgi:hypothetical protein